MLRNNNPDHFFSDAIKTIKSAYVDETNPYQIKEEDSSSVDRSCDNQPVKLMPTDELKSGFQTTEYGEEIQFVPSSTNGANDTTIDMSKE